MDFSAGGWRRVTLSKSEMLMGSSPENPLEWWILHLFVLEPPDCFPWILFCKHTLVILRASSHLLNKRTKKSQTKILNMRSNVHVRLWVMSVNKFGTNEFCLMITLELERHIKMQAYRPNKRANYPLIFFNLYLSVWMHVYGTCINVHVWYAGGGGGSFLFFRHVDSKNETQADLEASIFARWAIPLAWKKCPYLTCILCFY